MSHHDTEISATELYTKTTSETVSDPSITKKPPPMQQICMVAKSLVAGLKLLSNRSQAWRRGTLISLTYINEYDVYPIRQDPANPATEMLRVDGFDHPTGHALPPGGIELRWDVGRTAREPEGIDGPATPERLQPARGRPDWAFPGRSKASRRASPVGHRVPLRHRKPKRP